MRRILTLLTDFGTRDHYVAAVKGVLLRINPALNLVDITHQVTPHNIQEGSFLLASAFDSFPEGTVHLAVVDPGVGGNRRGLAAKSDHYFFVGPDNGIFDRVFTMEPPRLVVSLENPDYQPPLISATFHARDIFAPAAAHLSLELPLEALGPTISYQMHTSAPPRLNEDEVRGEVIHVDRFGNLISNIQLPSAEELDDLAVLQVFIADQPVLIGPGTYEEAPPLCPFALRGSSGYLEVAVRNGSAAEVMGQSVGAPVLVRRQK